MKLLHRLSCEWQINISGIFISSIINAIACKRSTLTIFYSKIHELNLEYKPGDENYFVIPDAFAAYKNMYEEELGIELPEVYEDYASISYTNINAGN